MELQQWVPSALLSKYKIFKMKWNANLMQQGNFIDAFLARHVSVRTPIIRSIRCWVAAYGFLHRVFGWVVVLRGADGAVHATIRTVHTIYAVPLKTTTHPKTRCKKPYAATQHLMLLVMGVCTETCRAKNTSIKLPSCIKLAFQFISCGRCTVKQPSSLQNISYCCQHYKLA